jgi:hypothetical protein
MRTLTDAKCEAAEGKSERDERLRTLAIVHVVPGAGLEPARLSAEDFESSASTDSATRALLGCARAAALRGRIITRRLRPNGWRHNVRMPAYKTLEDAPRHGSRASQH